MTFVSAYLPFYSYGVLMTIAFVLGLILVKKNLNKTSLKNLEFVDYALVISICALFGSRLLYIVLYPDQFKSLKDYLAIYEGGMVFFGGFLAAFIGGIAFAYFKKASLKEFLDACAAPLSIGHALGRIGCLINGCCYGKPTNWPQIYRLNTDPISCYRHPVQLYESIFLLLTFFALNYSFKRTYVLKKQKKGMTAGIYLLSYSIFRFFIENVRADDRGGLFTPFNLSISQSISVVLFGLAVLWIVYCNKNSQFSLENS